MSEDIAAESIIRRFFVFIKKSLDFDFEQDALMQRDLLDEKEKEDHICKDQCKAFWCERYLKRLIMKKTCKGFIAFIHDRPSLKIISETISMTQQQPLKSDLTETARVESSYPLTYEILQKHIYFLYTELEPREIADLMFQSGYLSCNDHDSITDSQQKYVRFMSLLNILKEKELFEHFACTLQSSKKYMSVLETLQEVIEPDVRPWGYAICIQHNFTFLQKELPDADCTRTVMEHLFDKTNEYEIDHCPGKIRKKSKLLKIILMKGNHACMELFKVIEAKLEREELIPEMKKRSADKTTRGKPDLPEQLGCLTRECLQGNKEFLLDELEPIDICDLLLEERAIEIMTHDRITETGERREQIKNLLQTLQQNENDCFHYFLYIIEKNEFNYIRNVLESPSASEAVRDEPREQSDLKLEHIVEKLPDNPENKTMEMRMTFRGDDAKRTEEDLYQELKSPASELLGLTMALGHMDIENVDSGSVVLRLRPLTDQAVQTLLNAKKNNKLIDMIIGMLKNINIADKINDTEPLKIKVQVYYASPAKENQVPGNTETRNAELIKHRLKAYRNKLVSDIEPSALASVLSKSFPKSDFGSVDQAKRCPRRVERLLSLIEKGEPDLVKEFLTVLKNFGYHEILELIDPPDTRQTAKDIREKIAYNFNRILEEMQITFARETLSNCIGDIDGIIQKILPCSGNRRQRMSNFLQFILKEDHNVIEFEKMLRNNGLEKLLKIDKNEQEEHVSSQNIEVTFVKDPKPSSSEILFESVITLSSTGVYRNRNIMAAISSKYPFGSAQEHPTCVKHDLTIDLTCEDCDEFICSQCVKTHHKDHDWKTISTAGVQRRKELKNTLSKVKEEDVKEMEEKIKMKTKQLEDNQKCCDSEVSKLQKHYNEIVSKLNEIKKNFETNLRKNLERKNAEVIEKKLDLEKKMEMVMDLEAKHGTMSDYSLIANLRDLKSLVSNIDMDIEKGGHSVRYRKGDINDMLLESMMGQMFNLDEITLNETDSFQYGDQHIVAMEAINEDTCFVRGLNSGNIKQVNRGSEKGMKTNINANDVCVTDNGDVYATGYDSNSIVRLSPSGSVSTVFRTAPLEPIGICQSTEGGLLVTLRDIESEPFQPNTHSRRLVRHVTLTGDVIHEYEYQEDGQTRLFTGPNRVGQNGNTDICVVNWTSESTGELVILSFSGSLKSVYLGQKLMNKFSPDDVVCDKHCNIIVNDMSNSKIHLLSPDGEFMKYLLTENEVTNPSSMSLYKSTLWVGDKHGLVKVFQYKS